MRKSYSVFNLKMSIVNKVIQSMFVCKTRHGKSNLTYQKWKSVVGDDKLNITTYTTERPHENGLYIKSVKITRHVYEPASLSIELDIRDDIIQNLIDKGTQYETNTIEDNLDSKQISIAIDAAVYCGRYSKTERNLRPLDDSEIDGMGIHVDIIHMVINPHNN